MNSSNSKTLPIEKITDPVFGEISVNGAPKIFYLCSANSFADLATLDKQHSRYFGLLVLADASQSDNESIAAAAESLFKKGLAFLCAWGPDCEKVHDLFDEAIVESELRDPEVKKVGTVMTTWHSDESLEEAVYDFVNHAWPDEGYRTGCGDWIIVAIGNPEWGTRAKEEIPKLVSTNMGVNLKLDR